MLDREDISTASNILNRYVAIHDSTFKFRLSSILPIPFLFSPIDFSTLHKDLLLTHNDLSNLITKRKLDGLNKPEYSVFFHYLVSLEMAVDKLVNILDKLERKADGDFTYPSHEYKYDHGEYQTLVKEYSILGKQLNQYI